MTHMGRLTVMAAMLALIACAPVTSPAKLGASEPAGYRVGAYYFGMFSPQGFDAIPGALDRVRALYGDARASGMYWWAGVQDMYEGNLTPAMLEHYPIAATWYAMDRSWLKPTISYYDQRDPRVIEQHIHQAVANGISYFTFYWYWRDGNEALRDGLESFLRARNAAKLDVSLAICAHGWGLDIPASEFQTVADLLVTKYFSRGNYLRTASGRPIIQICDAFGIRATVPEQWSAVTTLDIPALSAFVDTLRTTARAILGTEIVVVIRQDANIDWVGSRASGAFDGGACLAPLWPATSPTPAHNYQTTVAWLDQQAASWPFMPCLASRIDERPRLGILEEPSSIAYFADHPHPPSPEMFRAGLQGIKTWSDARPWDELSRFVTLYAWNEWHEGGILEPNARDGAALINQIPAVFSVPTSPASEWCRMSGHCPDAGALPYGHLDVVNCSVIWGWACDLDSPSSPIDVHFYAGPGFSSFVGATTANRVREAGVAAVCGGVATHGFVLATPPWLRDGQTRQIYAYAIDHGRGQVNPLIWGTPKPLTCAP